MGGVEKAKKELPSKRVDGTSDRQRAQVARRLKSLDGEVQAANTGNHKVRTWLASLLDKLAASHCRLMNLMTEEPR
jgi:hypothetical protein